MVTFGKIYKNISDIPEGSVINILPAPDYKGVYAWSTPWSCVFIPGFPLYRFECPAALFYSWGFLDELPNDVIVVSSCSDWGEYARERQAGDWPKMKEALLSPATPAPMVKKAKKSAK